MAVLDALNEATVVRLRLVVYGALIFFSFFIFVGVAVMEDKFHNRCPLYYGRDDLDGPESNCNYTMAISIMFQLLYTLFRVAILLLLVLGKLTTDMFLFSNIMELVYLLVDMVALLLTFIGACILSAGHNISDASNHNGWYSPSRAAQAGAWISTFLWLFIALVGFLYMMRAGKLPFGGGQAASSTTDQTNKPGGDTPHMEPPPQYPDDNAPKY